MVSMSKAQVGARVYNGFSQSPNRGQVSAQGATGYIQREMRKKRGMGGVTPYGNDGQSDNRSAVAARALARQSPNGGVGGTPNGGPQHQGHHIKKHPYQNGGRPVTTGPNAPGGQGGPPPITINDQGLLVLPYNQDFSAAQFQAFNDANNQLLGLKGDADNEALQYTQGKMDSEKAYKALQAQTLNGNAARGTAFSSAYGTAVASNAGNFANEQGQLESGHTAFTNNLHLQQAAIQAALNQQLGLATQQYGNDLSADAGTLGFGTNNRHPRHRRGKK